jgi:hypothetical protein
MHTDIQLHYCRTYFSTSCSLDISLTYIQTRAISVFVTQAEDVLKERSINREEGHGSGGDLAEESDTATRPVARSQTEA